MTVSLDRVSSRLISMSFHFLFQSTRKISQQQVSVLYASSNFDLRCISFIWKQNFTSDRHSKDIAGILHIKSDMFCPKPCCNWNSVFNIVSMIWVLKKCDGRA
jgi:hypothetical protein